MFKVRTEADAGVSIRYDIDIYLGVVGMSDDRRGRGINQLRVRLGKIYTAILKSFPQSG